MNQNLPSPDNLPESNKRCFYDNWVDRIDSMIQLMLADAVVQLTEEKQEIANVYRKGSTSPDGTNVTSFFIGKRKVLDFVSNDGSGEDDNPTWKILTYNLTQSNESDRQRNWKADLW